ncbi:retrovirus-related pol polyprotein from transposon TNT 1-94 [Tanacetum coccineum]
MSTSSTHQQSLANADSKTRPPMLERGSYIPWVSRFKRYLNRKRENRKWLNKAIDEVPYVFKNFTPEAEIEAMNLILISIPNDIYNSVDACTTAQAMWQRVECLMRGTVQNKVDRETRFNNENQAIVQGDKVNIQIQNSGIDGRNTRRSFVQEEIIKGKNVQNDAGNIQRTLRTTSSGSAANIQCYNCSEKDEAGVNLTNEQNDFLIADATRMEEIEKLSVQIILDLLLGMFKAYDWHGDYVQGNITVCHVYYVEGQGHNLFSVGQFRDGDLEVSFRSNTCYVQNLEGDDLLTRARESNLYTISILDMAASSPVCLFSKATSTKSWLWHHRLLHLNFGTINDLTKRDLVVGLPKFKYSKDHLCFICERGKSKKSSHPPKVVPSNHSKLELLHMDLFGPMRVASINEKKHILVIVDDYSRFTWVYFLRTKDETTEIIKNFIARV